MSNALFTIEIYRHAGTWCFSDAERDLLHEPFVLGIPEMINILIRDKHSFVENSKYRVTFAATPFPKTKFYLQRETPEANGYWYTLQEIDQPVQSREKAPEGWLCPATLKFFDDFPAELYVDIAHVGTHQTP
jgi:hypothetical protein